MSRDFGSCVSMSREFFSDKTSGEDNGELELNRLLARIGIVLVVIFGQLNVVSERRERVAGS